MEEQIKQLAAKYARYGITESLLYEIMQRPDHGLTVNQRLIGLRVLLSTEYDEQEYFPTEEIAELMGTSEAEAYQAMIESGASAMQISIIPGGILEQGPGGIVQ